MKMRANEIDVMKGIGILLVILGHCVPDFPVDLRADAMSAHVERFVYTFHMPLFFFCSGFVLGFTPPSSASKFLKSRFLRLMVPYLTFSFVSLGLRILFSSFTRSGFNINDGLIGILFYGKFFWFVYVLFFILLLMELFRKSKYALLLMVGIGIFLYSLNIELFKLSQMGYFTIFTVVGYLLSPFRDKLVSMMHNFWIPIVLIIILIGLYFYAPPMCFTTKYLHRVVMAWAGIGALYSISLNQIKSKKMSGFINHFSKYSLQYYLIHMIVSLPCYYIVAAMHLNISILAVVMNFIVITAVSYLMLECLLRMKWCYKLIGIKTK